MKALGSIDPTVPGNLRPRQVWYASYGSNTHVDRLAVYLTGGRPPGGARSCPGCRDPRMPTRSVAVELTGTLYFATRSRIWGGGRAFYDARGGGRVAARAHLVSAQQFSDIVAQEMYREPGADLDLAAVLTRDRDALGPGRYETLVCPGRIDGVPVLTCTAPWGVNDVTWVCPSPGYIRFLASGLLSAGAWDAEAVAAYLAGCPGAAGHWTAHAVLALLGEADGARHEP